MRFLTTFNKTKECSFERWLKLVDDLKPHYGKKHGLKLIVATAKRRWNKNLRFRLKRKPWKASKHLFLTQRYFE